MSVLILEPGFLTTVQDLGRFAALHLGVPTAGAMDSIALMAANALVGNDHRAAGLEITLSGPTLAFDQACAIAIAGADISPHIDDREVESWHSYLVRPGSTLRFAERRSGARAYLAVSGGIAVEPWLGSRSTYLPASVGGFEGRALRAGDHLPVGKARVSLATVAGQDLPPERRPAYAVDPTLRVILGPHRDRFTEEAVDSFLAGGYRITQSSNRMGYRLKGPAVAHIHGPEVVSCGIPLGAIQVPGDGQPILLLADHQTTGGYPMVATVIQADLPLAAQCLPDEQLRFRTVGLQEARQVLRQLVSGLRPTGGDSEPALWAV